MNEGVGRFAAWTDPPALASNGRDYLLVWTEGTALTGSASRNLFSLLLHSAESLTRGDLDRRKKSIPTQLASQVTPTSARNGDHLLVAWSESFSTGDSANVQQQIVAARVTPDGQNLDGGGVIVAPSPSNQQVPAAAWDGTRTWIAWSNDYRGIQATYVRPDGTRPSATFSISREGYGPRMACGDVACLVVWAENRSHDTNQHELFASRIVNGEVLDLNGFLIGSGQSYVGLGDYDVATDGSRFEVVWADRMFNGGAILRSVLFGPLTAGIATRNSDLAATTAGYSSPHVVWNRREYDVLWIERSTLRGSRISAEAASFDGDVTGWAGVRVADSFTALTDLVAAGQRLYAGSATGVTQIDATTFAITGSIEVGFAPAIAALDAVPAFVVYSKEGRLFMRRFVEARSRRVHP
jgi:hypothetical protein